MHLPARLVPLEVEDRFHDFRREDIIAAALEERADRGVLDLELESE